MKQLYELDEKVSKDDLPDIYCDMDMVLCDFMTGADKAWVNHLYTQIEKQGGKR